MADGSARTREIVWCLLFGHDWIEHTAYRLEADTGRAVYGHLCETCYRFEPKEGAKERFENPMPTSFGEALEERGWL